MAQARRRAPARKKTNTRRKPASKAPAVPPMLWVAVGGVALLFVAILVMLSTREPQPPSSPERQTVKVERPEKPAKPEKPEKPPAKPVQDAREVKPAKAPEPVPPPPPPRYEFYKMLPEQKLVLPSDGKPVAPPTVAAPLPPKPPVSPGSEPRYELQVGSFRKLDEADRRKAELAMLGFSSTVQVAKVSGEDWYRVKIGPLPESEARRARDRLKQASINPLMVRTP